MERSIDSMGRIVIPVEERRKLKVDKGDSLSITCDGKNFILTPIREGYDDYRRNHKPPVDPEEVKREYPVGTIIKCLVMDESQHPVDCGSTGVITEVDSWGTIWVKWEKEDYKQTLLVDKDKFEVIARPNKDTNK